MGGGRPAAIRAWARRIGLALGLAVFPAGSEAVPIDVDGPTTEWVAVPYAGTLPDYSDDQQTGVGEADIVGDALHPALYTDFDDLGTADRTDGWLGFRIRLGEEQNPPGFSQVAVVGMDADLDGAIDLFFVVDNSGQDELAIFDPGSGANVSPSTTTITSTGLTYTPDASNYAWQPVDATTDPDAVDTDLDGGGTDRFLSFVLPFADVVARVAARGITGFDDATQVTFIVGTSAESNSLNQDLGGPPKNFDGDLTWAELGAQSQPITVPEPGSLALFGLGFALLAASRRRARRAFGRRRAP